MTEIVTNGTWRPSAGSEQAFVDAWAEFAAWASSRSGAGTLRLTRDERDAGRFVSFGRWEAGEAVRAWKGDPEFSDRLARVLQHVDEFEPTELSVVAAARSGASSVSEPAAAA